MKMIEEKTDEQKRIEAIKTTCHYWTDFIDSNFPLLYLGRPKFSAYGGYSFPHIRKLKFVNCDGIDSSSNLVDRTLCDLCAEYERDMEIDLYEDIPI